MDTQTLTYVTGKLFLVASIPESYNGCTNTSMNGWYNGSVDALKLPATMAM
jgi:hypothetical protein